MTIRSAVEDQIYGRTHSSLLGGALGILARVYRFGVFLRMKLFQYRILRSKKLPCKVFSVGNITLGGTGKTPAVVMLAQTLAARGLHPVVVSRGYGRKDEARTVVVSDGSTVLVDAAAGGDEPVLIASRLRGIPVVAGADRFKTAEHALGCFASDVVVLDDGFQHLKLRRDVDIVLIDATDPFGTGKLFPAGILRESVASLGRAQAVIVTKTDQAKSVDALKETIRQSTKANIFTSIQRPVEFINIMTGEHRPLAMVRNTKTLAFSGIARPAAFSSLLKTVGAHIVAEFVYPDHYWFQRDDLASIYQKAADTRAAVIVTTEKDAVRLRPLKPEGIWALRIELAVAEQEEWERFIAAYL